MSFLRKLWRSYSDGPSFPWLCLGPHCQEALPPSKWERRKIVVCGAFKQVIGEPK
jgi:hypothetical protein